MAKIPLRAYNKEIENLIDRGQTEEAIAHCKYILKHFPRHIDTYRMLGKSYLETQRYTEAVDILQRVLSVVPDDFVSQIGMSIIREDEGNLDASIYHMERAFEIQPSNNAVQAELRRLYGRRDGVEPPKLRLTRGALVRMYARSELFRQAIAELRAALNEDPHRVDLEILLAKMYYQSGQRIEALEVCNSLVTRLPFCYEANRILAEILPTTAHAEDAKEYQKRIYSLDPYLAYIGPNALTSSQVPDNAVTLDRLEWTPQQETTQAPAWAQTVGAKIDEPKEEIPDWFSAIPSSSAEESEEDKPTVISALPSITLPDLPDFNKPPAISQPTDSNEVIPEWMSNVGWGQSTGPEIPPPPMNEAEDLNAIDSSNISPAEIPDWLQNLAPAEEAGNQKITGGTDFLRNILPAEANQSTNEPLSSAVPPVNPLPPTLSSVSSQPLNESWTPDNEPTVKEGSQGSQVDYPDWMSSSSVESPIITSDNTAPAEIPDWLSEFQAPSTSGISQETSGPAPDWVAGFTQAPEETPQNVIDQQSAEAAPDWLQDFEKNSSVPDITGQPGKQVEEEETPEWLKTLSPADNTPQLTVEGNLPEEELPSPAWLNDFNDLAPSPITNEEEIALPAVNVPDWLTAMKPSADSTSQEQGDTANSIESSSNWFTEENTASELPNLHTEPNQEPLNAEAPVGIDTWLSTIDQSPSAIESSPALVSEPIDNQTESIQPSTQPDSSDMDAAISWLESLAAKQGADEQTLTTPIDSRNEVPPDWIRQEMESTQPAIEQQPSEAVSTPSEVPEWLQQFQPLEPSDSTSTNAQSAPSVEIPDWLNALEAEEPGPNINITSQDGIQVPPLEFSQLKTDQDSDIPNIAEFSIPEMESRDTSVEEFVQPEAPLNEMASITPLEAEGLEPMPAPSELPDWLKDTGPLAESPISPDELSQEETPEWLRTIEANSTAEQTLQPETPTEDKSLPDWLADTASLSSSESLPAVDEVIEPLASSVDQPVHEEIATIGVSEDLPGSEIPPQIVAFPEEPTEPATATKPVPVKKIEAPQSEMPEWLKQVEVVADAAPEEPIDNRISTEPVTANPAEMDIDAALAWMESLAAKQGAQEETLSIPADKRQEQPPAWVIDQEVSPPSVDTTETVTQEQTIPESILSVGDETQNPSWLSELKPPEPETQPEIEHPLSESLPEWLNLDKPGFSESTPSIPVEMAESSTEVTLETESMAPQGFSVEDTQPISEVLPSPELPLVEEIAEISKEPVIENSQTVEDVTPEPVMGMNAPTETVMDPASILEIAKSEIENGKVEDAAKLYDQLVQSDRKLEETIHDLRDALYRFPIDIGLWQTLGDAYIRSNRLQEALDAYTKAEELLR